jgi:hypothetical protein
MRPRLVLEFRYKLPEGLEPFGKTPAALVTAVETSN